MYEFYGKDEDGWFANLNQPALVNGKASPFFNLFETI